MNTNFGTESTGSSMGTDTGTVISGASTSDAGTTGGGITADSATRSDTTGTNMGNP